MTDDGRQIRAEIRAWIQTPIRPPTAPTRSPKLVGLGGLEPPASPLSGVRANHLSYRPKGRTRSRQQPLSLPPRRAPRSLVFVQVSCVGARWALPFSKGGDPAAPSDTATLLRLHPSHRPHRGKRPPTSRPVKLPASGATNSHGVTGGVYKARERIHRDNADSRLLAIPTSRSRVADCDPD